MTLTPSQKLRKHFDKERARFVLVFPQLVKARLVIVSTQYPSGDMRGVYRDLARCSGFEITVVERLGRMPAANIVGVLRHELGHVADDRVHIDRGVEQRADDIAELVTGLRVYYDDADIQSTRPGVYPRPKHLPR